MIFPDLKTPLIWLLGAALVCALATAGIERTRRAKADANTAALKAEFAEYRATQAEAGRHADKAERSKEKDREDQSRQAAAAARALADAAGAAADRAAAAGRRLLDQQATAALYLRACQGAAAAPGSPSADTAASVLADVRRRLDDAENATIRFADRSRISGLACERIHDTLTTPGR